MALKGTDFEANETIAQVIDYLHISITNLTNSSQETQIKFFDLFEAYRTREKEQLGVYKFVAYVIGTLIILSNLTVVISSGLILKKGQQPKSTYLLLGNVSLADTIIGISIIFGAIVDNSRSSNPLCIFQIGMLVCPAMVSIFSVGLIAVDRYIYILHGLYYQRWFNTTKVRIGIVCIWIIGVTLSFLPATGWKNEEFALFRCTYVGIFPGSLVIFNSLLSIVPIIVVAVLYSIILVKALKNVNNIKAAEKSVKNSSAEPKLRIYIGNPNPKNVVSAPSSMKHRNKDKENKRKLRRSASFDIKYEKPDSRNFRIMKPKSINDLIGDNDKTPRSAIFDTKPIEQTQYDSKFSICSIESSCSDVNVSGNDVKVLPSQKVPNKKICKKTHKPKHPNKFRAITVVMLTSGSFLMTWLPFFIVIIFFVLCEEKLTNPKCLRYRTLLKGPLITLAFFNSILNPLIYAWWHRGFQRTVRTQFRTYCRKYFSKNVKFNTPALRT